MPKARRVPRTTPTPSNSIRHKPLHIDILEQKGYSIDDLENSDEKYIEKCINSDEEDARDDIVPEKLGDRLLKIVQEQQDEVDQENDIHSDDDNDIKVDKDGYVILDNQDDGDFDVIQNPFNKTNTVNLADLILAQINKSENGPPDDSVLSEKAQQVYATIGQFLTKYKSGKIPKAFKIIPRLKSWEEVLLLTNPTCWSKCAMREATTIFCSNLKESKCQRFLNLVLLPAVREDIHTNKKLNYHLYMALKKALFKPGAFFKGIYLPMAIDGSTIREAVIVSSVVAKVSIPVLHGAAALCRLCSISGTEWNTGVSYYMHALIDKKYSLPIRAIQMCVDHFAQFMHLEPNTLPVSWHRCLLTFIQRYKGNFDLQQRETLFNLVKVQFHYQITPQIRNELNAPVLSQILLQQHMQTIQKQ